MRKLTVTGIIALAFVATWAPPSSSDPGNVGMIVDPTSAISAAASGFVSPGGGARGPIMWFIQGTQDDQINWLFPNFSWAFPDGSSASTNGQRIEQILRQAKNERNEPHVMTAHSTFAINGQANLVPGSPWATLMFGMAPAPSPVGDGGPTRNRFTVSLAWDPDSETWVVVPGPRFPTVWIANHLEGQVSGIASGSPGIISVGVIAGWGRGLTGIPNELGSMNSFKFSGGQYRTVGGYMTLSSGFVPVDWPGASGFNVVSEDTTFTGDTFTHWVTSTIGGGGADPGPGVMVMGVGSFGTGGYATSTVSINTLP